MKQRMRISALLLALVLCLSLLPVPAFAAPVTFAAAFPSENFRQQLNDAVLTPAGLTAEDETELTDAHLAALRAATSLSLQDIEDYTGLELLTGLTELKLRQKATLIEWLDLRANTKLQKLGLPRLLAQGLGCDRPDRAARAGLRGYQHIPFKPLDEHKAGKAGLLRHRFERTGPAG